MIVNNSNYIIGTHPNNRERPPLEYNPDDKFTNNGHALICGSSGAGKTTLLYDMVRYLYTRNKHIYIFDLKGDMQITKNGEEPTSNSELIGNYINITSWESEYGINAFEFNTGVPIPELEDIINNNKKPTSTQMFKLKNAGPKMQSEIFVEIMKKNFLPNMSSGQAFILRSLFMDSYKMKGIIYNDPKTWLNSLPCFKDTLTLIDMIEKKFIEDERLRKEEEKAMKKEDYSIIPFFLNDELGEEFHNKYKIKIKRINSLKEAIKRLDNPSFTNDIKIEADIIKTDNVIVKDEAIKIDKAIEDKEANDISDKIDNDEVVEDVEADTIKTDEAIEDIGTDDKEANDEAIEDIEKDEILDKEANNISDKVDNNEILDKTDNNGVIEDIGTDIDDEVTEAIEIKDEILNTNNKDSLLKEIDKLEKEIDKLFLDFRKKSYDTYKSYNIIEKGKSQNGYDNWFYHYNIDSSSYNNRDKIRSILKLKTDIENLDNSGVFNMKKLPVKAGLNIINISGLQISVQRFFVDVIVGTVFRACKLRGTYADMKHKPRGAKLDTYIVIDESKLVAGNNKEKNDPYSFLGRVASESRSSGLGLIVASQSAEHFPLEFLKNFYLQIVLTTSVADSVSVKRSFDIDTNLLSYTSTFGNALVKCGKEFIKIRLNALEKMRSK